MAQQKGLGRAGVAAEGQMTKDRYITNERTGKSYILVNASKEPMEKEEWVRIWKKRIIESGYYFAMNKAEFREGVPEEEMKDLPPEVSADMITDILKELCDNEAWGNERL